MEMAKRDIIAIGGSLGGVEAVRRLCAELPPELAATVFIVVHVGAEGNDLLAGIFDAHSAIAVSTATDGEIPRPGHAYVAPADRHLLVIDGTIRLGRGPRENLARPAIDPLFRSLAVGYGPRVVAVLLTGLLNDGAAGLADVHRCGGVTVVQNPGDALAADMPLSALRATDVDYRAPVADMTSLLVKLAGEDAGPRVPIPSDLMREVDIALGRKSGTDIVSKFADPVAMSCPDCGGVLSQVRRGPPLRFRCQIGHAYTAETLVAEKDGTVEEAMRVAMRIMEERAVLSRKMAEEARLSGRPAAAASFEQRLDQIDAYIAILRRAIEGA
jgi:two-component system chemotaxis response regulator CheB